MGFSQWAEMGWVLGAKVGQSGSKPPFRDFRETPLFTQFKGGLNCFLKRALRQSRPSIILGKTRDFAKGVAGTVSLPIFAVLFLFFLFFFRFHFCPFFWLFFFSSDFFRFLPFLFRVLPSRFQKKGGDTVRETPFHDSNPELKLNQFSTKIFRF